LALIVALIVITSLWGFVVFVLNETPRWRWLRRARRRVEHAAGAESSSLSASSTAINALSSEADGSAASPPH
jgi:hypothetical protein